MNKKLSAVIISFLMIGIGSANAWHDRTHISVGIKAGFDMSYNLAGPDVAKIKAGEVEGRNHYSNLTENFNLTPEFVKAQIVKYNDGSASEENGHLYGAIIAAIRQYQHDSREGKYAKYHLAYVGHYCGDLSNPFHNSEYDSFNKKHHTANDGIIELEVEKNLDKIIVTPIEIKNEDDLIKYIIEIAKESNALAYKLEKENRDMTKEEAYARISRSASLFKGILEYVGYNKKK